MSRLVLSVFLITVAPGLIFANGQCGRIQQRSMMQTTCRQQTPCQPGGPEMQRRMMMTTLLQRQREFQMTSLLLRQREFQMTSLLQRVRQPATPFTPRLMTPLPRVPSTVPPPMQQTNLRPPLAPQPNLQLPFLRMPQFYTGLRWPGTPGVPFTTPPANHTPVTQKVVQPQTPVQKPDNRPFVPIVRTPDEQSRFSEEALQRGLVAEGEGNYILARACYRTALTYPDTVAAQSARKTLKRVQTLLEEFPALAESSYSGGTGTSVPRTNYETKSTTPQPIEATTVPQQATTTAAPARAPGVYRLFNPRMSLPTAITTSR